MGSKLTRVCGHKAVTASPRVLASQQSQELYNHACEQTDNNTTATSASTHDHPECEPAATPDTDAMDVDQRPPLSTDPRPASILRDSEQLPGFALVAEDDQRSIPNATQLRQPLSSPPSSQNCLICCTPCDGPGKDPAKEVYPCNSCTHAYCVPCLKDMFLAACRDLSRMPPRCCTQIPLHHVRPYLTTDEISLFKAKYEEWGTSNPFYCPIARCSTFIPNHLLPQARANGKGKQRVDSGIGTPTKPTVTCPECEVEICTNCRSLAHASGICSPFDFGVDEQTADLLQKWGYRKCPKCGQGVKRMFGCNHMECRCGAHFCWGCMQGRDNCVGDCDDDEDEYSNYEPDEEGDDETEEEKLPATIASPTREITGSQTLPATTTSTTTTEKHEDPAIETPPSEARVRNLDGGSGRYWEEQGFDFGDEPTDDYQDRSWDMKDAFAKGASTHHMECMKCWAPVHPEVQMPASIRTGKFKTTTAVASAGRRAPLASRRMGLAQHARRHAPASLRHNRSMEELEPVVAASRLSTSPASFSGFMPPPSSLSRGSDQLSQEDSTACVLDLYGNTVATAKQPQNKNADEEMPDWEQAEGPKNGLSFATNSTPFSFAYECNQCGLLVCHRCKDRLQEYLADEAEGEKEDGVQAGAV
jgi:hypothetical protein